MKALLYISGIILVFALQAQVVSDNGRFRVDFNKGCAPFTINVTNLTSSGTPQYIYESGVDPDGYSDLTTYLETTFTYEVPGLYYLIQINNSFANSPNGTTDTLIVEIIDAVPPSFSFSYCDSTFVQLLISDSLDYDFYEIYLADDTISSRSTGLNPVLELERGRENVIEVKGVYENAKNNCQTSSISVVPRPPVLDVELEQLEIDYLCEGEIAVNVHLEPAANTAYEIEYSNGGLQEVIFTGIPEDGLNRFENIPLPNPATEICLDLYALAACGGARIGNDQICQTLPANFSAVDEAYATYSGSDILVDFENNESGTISIDKVTENTVVQEWDSINSGFLDTSISPIRQYDYILSFIPACGADTQQLSISTPYIEISRVRPNTYEVAWTEASYQLEGELSTELIIRDREDSLNRRFLPNPSNPQEISLDNELGSQQVIQLVQFFSDLPVALKSNPVAIDYEWKVFVPGTFTPNDDGLNDRLEVFGLPSDEFNMTIYNKWGEPVYRCDRREDFWNGIISNQPASYGVYIYYIEFKNQQGIEYSQRGSFILLQN